MATGSLIAIHLLFYATFSVTGFAPLYLGEIGMTQTQIGMLLSISAIIGAAFQPAFGILADRTKTKKTVVIGLLALLVGVSLVLDRMTTFVSFLVVVSVYAIVQMPISPTIVTISLEHAQARGISYGPIRLLGTVGYQLGALLPGWLLLSQLTGLYRLLAMLLLLSLAAAVFLPAVKGHQHQRAKVSPFLLLKNRRFMAILGFVLIGTIASQYYLAFFSLRLQELSAGNSVVGWMLLVSVLPEIPFLLFADKLSRKISMWNGFIIAYVLTGLRFILIALTKSVPVLFFLQIPQVVVLACFEFMPAMYINRHIDDTLKASAQVLLTFTAFGVSRVIGTLLCGFLSDVLGITAVFFGIGVLLLICSVLCFYPARRLANQP